MEMQLRQMALSEYQAGLIDPMTYYEQAGYEGGTEIQQRMIEQSIRDLPSVRQKIETLVARQAAMGPQIPGMDPTGGGGGIPPAAGGAPPQGPPGGSPADINSMLTPNTFRPDRIDIGR